MCGIAGFLSNNASEESAGILRKMLARLSHRGPEAVDVAVFPQLALGRSLLGFNCIGNNNQPLLSDDSQVVIVFNGELYNQADLKHRLEGFGYCCESDTQTILSLYLHDGPVFVKKLEGMFAIAIFDFRSHRLILARDPFGEKPLYYFSDSTATVFASELSALLQHPLCPTHVDELVLQRYLAFNAVPAPYALLRGVRKVSPGSMIVFENDSSTEVVYWKIPSFSSPSFHPRDWEEEFESGLKTSIEHKLASSDCKLGTFLSGGVDSAIITLFASHLSPSTVPAFSVAFEDSTYDESRYAKQVAQYCGIEHHIIPASLTELSVVAINRLKELDEPIADPALLPYLLLCERTRQVVKGVLSGDGADEMLLGYRIFEVINLLETLEHSLPSAVLTLLAAATSYLPVSDVNMNMPLILRALARGLGISPELRWYESTGAFNTSERKSLLRGTGIFSLEAEEIYREVSCFVAHSNASTCVSRAQLGMIYHYLRDLILSRVDRGSMLNGLEVRCPFLDTTLVGLMMSMPQSLKLKGRRGKWILRKIASKYLPREIAERKKQGFRIPLGQMLRSNLREFTRDTLSSTSFKTAGLFNAGVVSKLVSDHMSGRRDNQKAIWALLCFQVWLDQLAFHARSRRAVEMTFDPNSFGMTNICVMRQK